MLEGRSRVSEVIKIITVSQWTHAALYISSQRNFKKTSAQALVNKHYQGDPDLPLVIESLLSFVFVQLLTLLQTIKKTA